MTERGATEELGRPGRVALVVMTMVVGTVTGVATVLVHREPGLFALAAAATVAVMAALPDGPTAPAWSVGWVLPLLVLMATDRGGGVVVVLDLPGIALLVLGVVVVVTGVARARRRPS